MIVKNVNPNKLHDELINIGLAPILVTNDREEGKIVAENTWITFADGADMELVQQIINAHDPSPLPMQLTEIELVKLSQAEQFETILEILGGLM